MSTNPFRQIKSQQEQSQSSHSTRTDTRRLGSDGSGSQNADLYVDTRVPTSLDRHVSFASPPVDTIIPAASYPSSPEELRSPPVFQTAQPTTPDYRTAFQRDPFTDLGRHGGEDHTIQEALNNAQSNAEMGSAPGVSSGQETVRDTLSRFATGPRSTQPTGGAPQPSAAVRQSLDVEAFKRLLLTGDSGQNTPGTATPPAGRLNRALNDTSSSTDTTSLSQYSISSSQDTTDAPRISIEHVQSVAVGEERSKPPPPAPAPRRGKSVKSKALPPPASRGTTHTENTGEEHSRERMLKKPPTPPLSRRLSARTASLPSEEGAIAPVEADSPPQPPQPATKPPPPPPMRRQHSLSQQGQRRASNDLAPTIEEPEPELAPSISSRRSSNDRPIPPPSRSASGAAKRQSVGFMQPPPLPPPRRGRESSRSSMDSYRPSLASIIGDEGAQENETVIEDSRRTSVKNQRSLAQPNAPSTDSILAELANLQKEVDAARRGA